MKKYIVVIISVIAVFSALAQNPNLTVSSLNGVSVDSILQQHLQGDGVVMSGFGNGVFSSNQAGKFNGQTTVTYDQIGTFNRNGFTDFPFETGLVLTTGNVSVAEGPNSTYNASTQVNNHYTDVSLSQYTTNTVMSTASLEFDFIASSDMFSVNYIFGSEEYCEYVNTNFNDVFAISLTGLDPVTLLVTTKVVSIVPGTITTNNPNGIPVNIDNVNHGQHGPGGGTGTQPSNSQYFICNGGNTNGIQYDGYTTALSAQSNVFACQNYHVKIAVANVGDNSLDSGVFLEESSFSSPQVEIGQVWSTEEGGDTLAQYCRDMDLTFSFQHPVLTSSTAIIINTGGDALLGTDYIMSKSDGTQITLDNNSFYYPVGDSVQLVHVEILPTAQFATDTTVKTVYLYVTTQGCSGNGMLQPYFHKTDTIILHLKAASPDTSEFTVSCPDSCYTWNGVEYCESGDYTQEDECHVMILHLTITVGVDEYQNVDFKVYPNPTSAILNVECTMNNEQLKNTEIQVMDAYGKLVRSVETRFIASSQRSQINISELSAGVYFVKLVADDRVIAVRKIVKQ